MKTSCCSSSSSSLFVVTALALSGVAFTTTSAEDAASLPTNTAQLCQTNAVGTTCPSGANLPDVACCASGVTGAFFNACCPADFVGINMGPATATYTKQFAMDMVTGTGLEEAVPAICGVSADGTGCPVLQTPENEAAGNQPLILPAGVEGPCVAATTTTTCSETAGTCTASDGSTFDVCCPTCATGTYLPGQSCNVILPDPAACGINIMSKDNNETDATDVDVGAEESADDADAESDADTESADADADADADVDADADAESADPLIVLSTDVPTVAPVEVPTSMVPTSSTVDDVDEGTPSPTLKEGDAPSVTAPSEVVQPIFEAPVAPAPISAAPGRRGRRDTVVAMVAATTTTIAIVVAAVVAAV